jgi:hypothetical protein
MHLFDGVGCLTAAKAGASQMKSCFSTLGSIVALEGNAKDLAAIGWLGGEW